jgi:hypothetical protein
VNLDDGEAIEPFTIPQPPFGIRPKENDAIAIGMAGKFSEQVQTKIQYSPTSRCGEWQEIETYFQTVAQNYTLIASNVTGLLPFCEGSYH